MIEKEYKKFQIIEDLEIQTAAALGKGLGRIGEIVVFVENAVPGDVVDVQIVKKKSRFFDAKVVKLKKPSEKRVNAPCAYFGVCGGCKWQNFDYQEQLKYKTLEVEDSLRKFAKVELPEIPMALGSDNIYFYRNKMDFGFSNTRWLTADEVKSEEKLDRDALGFHVPGFFDKVIDIEKCHLQPEPSNAIRNFVRDFAKTNNLSFYNSRQHVGVMRGLMLRNNLKGDFMAIIQFGEESDFIKPLADAMIQNFKEIKSLYYVVNLKKNDTIHDLNLVHHFGDEYLIESMEDLNFRINPKSFYQTNPSQAYNLYKITRDFADLKGSENVYDLYTGTGTIAQFIAKKAKQVIGIEYVPEAIEDAKINARENKLDNTVFYAGDMKDLLTPDLFLKHGKPDVIITDPPRAGMHDDVTKRINQSGAKKIVYVSCNPATQARDIEILSENYDLIKVQPVDMFPHTYHIENVALLTLKEIK